MAPADQLYYSCPACGEELAYPIHVDTRWGDEDASKAYCEICSKSLQDALSAEESFAKCSWNR